MGKTTLLERLVPEIASRGLAVSLIKHSHKNIDIDRPGKDSYRLRESGCKECCWGTTAGRSCTNCAARQSRSWTASWIGYSTATWC
jgi:molybdopterin-guanine dinucleotide biosynthesis protein MobB